MDKSWITKPRLSQDYMIGVRGFLDFAFSKIKADMLKCPCQCCCLVKYKCRVDIEGDLICHGFLLSYTNWYLHGEELDDFDQAVSLDQLPTIDQIDPALNLLADVFPSMSSGTPSRNQGFDEFTNRNEDPLKQKRVFDELLSDGSEPLYEGCQSFSKLTFMLRLYHIKCISRISDKGMSMIIDLLKEAFEHAKFPDSFSDMKNTIRKLGLTYETIRKLCDFFRKITSKVLDLESLDKLQEHIALTLCHLEMVFPPSFFTVMMHLTIHLIEEVKLGGPVQYRWMYPIERVLGRFKSYVRNRARPEGSICEQYIADECLTFCSMYFEGVETKFNRIGRMDDHPLMTHVMGSESQIPLIFPLVGRPVGVASIGTLNSIERHQAHRYILINSPFLDDYRETFKRDLRRSQLRRRKRGAVMDVDRHVHLHFGQWLKLKVEKNEFDGVSDDIRCLAQGPSDKVLKFSAYNINGFKYRIIDRDQDLKTQNSGVFVSAETISYASSRDANPRAGDVSYYGKLTEILELNYYDSFRVVLFKCKWVDTRDARGYKKDDFGHTMVNFSRLIHTGNGEEDEPYVLASQARLVYYVEDPKEDGWSVVVHVQPRDIYDMGDQVISDDNPQEFIFEDHAVQRSRIISDNVPNIRLVRQLEDLDNSQISCDLDDNMEV